MLITDLVEKGDLDKCDGRIVERMRIDAVVDELARSKGPGFDPGTRPKLGKIIRDNAKITGTISSANGQMTIVATHTDYRTGKSTSFTEVGPNEDFFAMEERLAAKLGKHVCDPPDEPPPTPPAPPAYSGTFSGSYDLTNAVPTPLPLVVTWTGGTLRFADRQPIQDPTGASYRYSVVSGSASVTVRYRRGSQSGCDFDGTETVDFGPSFGGPTGTLTTYPDEGPPYRVLVGFQPMAAVTFTRSNCAPGEEDQNGTEGDWPLYSYESVGPDGVLVGSGGVLAGTQHTDTPGEPEYDFTWSFVPAE
jgi:hypothetical protein